MDIVEMDFERILKTHYFLFTSVNYLHIIVTTLTFSIFMITEEILEQSRATWFSKKGGNLLYATFNATSVGEVSFKLYGDESNDLGTNFEENSKSEPNLYGKTKSLRYPKV
jgi:hypothetical protein